MKILISTDSAADLTKEIIEKNNIKTIPLPITLGKDTFLDGVEITPEKIFEFVEEHKILPKTSAINEFTYDTFFSENTKLYDAIVHFTISSEVSCCFQNAEIASKKFDNVFVIDTQTLSTGVALHILYALKLREKGLTAKEIYDKTIERLSKVQATFVIEKLDYLHKGGRCSGLQMFGANILKLRPSIIVKDGKLHVHKKYKGKMHDVVEEFILETLKENPNYDKETCFLTYSSATDEMLQKARETLKQNSNFKNIIEARTGATITSHCGKNTLGILFFNK